MEHEPKVLARRRHSPKDSAIMMQGTIRKLGLEGGLWALITDDGRTIELIDAPKPLRKDGLRAKVEGKRDRHEVSVGMVGDAIVVERFELID